MGIEVADNEIVKAIRNNRNFKDLKGNYVGDQKLKQFLISQGSDIKEFENDIRKQLIYDKYLGLIRQSVFATTEQLKKDYVNENENTSFDYVSFEYTNFLNEAKKNIEEKQVEDYFNKNKEEFKIPLMRKIKYVLFSPTRLEKDIIVSDSDVKKYYNDNILKYTVEEQVKAQHILVGTKLEKRSDKDALIIVKKVQNALKKGMKFEDAAKKFSDDKASAVNGGDLGFFTKEKMVKEFSDAAFALKIGGISKPVKSTYGYHIIKTTDRIEGKVDSLEEVKGEIVTKLKIRKAKEKAAKEIDKFKASIKDSNEFDKLAKESGNIFKETEFFANDPFEVITGLGPNRAITDVAFSLKLNEISTPVSVPEGYVIFKLIGEREPHLPEFSEVKDKVKNTVVKNIAMKMAKKGAESFRLKLNPKNFKSLAKKMKLEVKKMPKSNRLSGNMIFPKNSDEFEKIFSYNLDQITEVMEDSSNNYVICLITDKDNVDDKVFFDQIKQQRSETLNEKSKVLLNSTIKNARKQLEKDNRIRINPKFNETKINP